MVDKLLVDTSVLLEDPDVLLRIFDRGGVPILSNTILQELDFNKTGDKETNRNARHLFREFTKSSPIEVNKFPDNLTVANGDILTSINFKTKQVYILSRKKHQTKINNDYKIIEIAQEYDCIILTKDKALCLQAETLGVRSVIWTGMTQRKDKIIQHRPTPFYLSKSPSTEPTIALNVKKIPVVGDMVHNVNGLKLMLTKEITSGGEGTIYETNVQTVVCKIYKQSCLTNIRRKKIELMLSRPINYEGLCWPLDISFNMDGEFVGYVMPKAAGKPIQSTMFVKPVLNKNFPNWQRINLIDICIQFLRQVEFLHQMNIIIGDINPLNLLLSSSGSKIWLVDTDSFQIEEYPCPVGTVNFTAPEIQGVDCGKFMRTKQHEAFSVATMIFMLLLPGKPPYSQQGGGSPGENIKNMEFPYRHGADTSSKNAPQGPWFLIWNNLPFYIREGFSKTFREGNRLTVDQWIKILLRYEKDIKQSHYSNDIFPEKIMIRNGIPTICTKCAKVENASQSYLNGLVDRNQKFLCASCVNDIKIKKLARLSAEANATAMNGGVPVELKATCTKCSISETTSKKHLNNLQERDKSFLCKKCIAYNQSSVSAICQKCGSADSTSQKWLDNIHAKGKNFLCRTCVSEIQSKRPKAAQSNNSPSSTSFSASSILGDIFKSFF